MSKAVDLLSDLEITMLGRQSFIGRALHSAARTIIKKIILPVTDPVVRRTVHGVDLDMPLSHDLPRYTRQYPYYDTVLPSLAKFLLTSQTERRKLILVDVGANVGDTVRLVSDKIGSENIDFICVEADEIYLPLLRKNTEHLSVTIHNVIAGSRTEELDTSFARDHSGTSSVVSGGERRRAVALDELILGHVVDVIKIDTDGYEAQVVMGLDGTLTQSDPLIFMEYSPRHLIRYGKINPTELLQMLKIRGYDHLLIYDYRGYPMGRTQLSDQSVRNITNYCLAVPGFYMDVLLAKGENLLSRFYDWDLNRYLG